MTKIYVTFSIICLFFLTAFSVMAAECRVEGAKVTRIFQWRDGNIFVVFDKKSDCNCSIPIRMGFHKNDDEKFFMSAALTALTTGKPVDVRGEDLNCPIHGDTAKMTNFSISAN